MEEQEYFKANEEKIRIEQKRIREEKRMQELFKQQKIEEWVNANTDKYEKKKMKIKEDLSIALAQQKIKAEKKKKLNEIRYQEILTNIETSKEISRNILFVTTKRNLFLKSIEDRNQQEERLTLPKIAALDAIKEKLSHTTTLDQISQCFSPDSV